MIGTGWKTASAGYNHSAALKTDGVLYLWGSNTCGQLGDGTVTPKNTPMELGTGWKTVMVGNNFTAGIKTDGSLWMWGVNSNGQLGNGTNIDCHTPAKVLLPLAERSAASVSSSDDDGSPVSIILMIAAAVTALAYAFAKKMRRS
jgi:alpha-tubulin suppressor-like RCC1 family protein